MLLRRERFDLMLRTPNRRRRRSPSGERASPPSSYVESDSMAFVRDHHLPSGREMVQLVLHDQLGQAKSPGSSVAPFSDFHPSARELQPVRGAGQACPSRRATQHRKLVDGATEKPGSSS
jgi:hypothetical protein